MIKRKIPVCPEPLSVIVLFLALDCPERALVAVHGDNFQQTIVREGGQDDGPFQSHNLRLLTIVLWNIPLSQNVDRYARSTNSFSVFQDVFKIPSREVSLCHSQNSVLGNIES
jgi:hypothetical protein